jgi:peptidoglycan hydrolase-like protein with peptidoglycan-binding domain
MTTVSGSTSSAKPTLREGAVGPDVIALQEMLNAARACPTLTADGVFGSGTSTAVKAFQRANGLEVDGVAGSSTWAALEAISAASGGASPAPEISGPNATKLPASSAVFEAFAKALGLRAAGVDEDLGGLLAAALEVPSASASVVVEPGRIESVLGVLETFQRAARPAGRTPTQVEAALSDRLAALVAFCGAQAGLPAERRASAQRILVVCLAMSQIGAVSAHEASPSSSAERYGWERLNEIFLTSFGDESYGVSSVRYLDHDLMAWCGLFALWASKTAGASLGTWKIGHGVGAVSGIGQVHVGSAPHEDLLPGDIGYVSSPHQHHYVVVSVDRNGVITSVDGNSTDTVDACTYQGVIVSSSHTVAGTSAFYRATALG